MARVDFTPNLARQTAISSREVPAETVREALEALFREFPAARGYVLDDQGTTRQHVAIFVDGEVVKDRIGLSDPVDDKSVVFVMQALSGG
jgi:molybdopterin synthase sulfur carrier subunit